MDYLIPILFLAALCGGWFIFQKWYAAAMPEAPGIGRRCDGCTGDNACGETNSACAMEAGEATQATVRESEP